MKGPLSPKLHGLTLSLVTALMTFFCGLAFLAQDRIHSAVAQWGLFADQTAIIAVSPDAEQADERLAQVQKSLNALPGIRSSERLSADRIRSLLEPWIGSAASQKDAMGMVLPLALSVRYVAGTDLSTPVRRILPEAEIEETRRWTDTLRPLGTMSLFGASVMTALLGAAALFVIALSVRQALIPHRETVTLLYSLGASARQIAGRLCARAALIGFGGGVAGLALILFFLDVMIAAATGTLPVLTSLLPQAHACLAALIALPFASALWAAVITRNTLRFWLRHLP